MAKVSPIRVANFQGGLDKSDKSIIKDNQLATATNVFYNQDKNLQTRYGIANFGNPVPDAVIQIEDTDSTTVPNTWAAADDAASLAADTSTTFKRGSGAIGFDISVAGSVNDYATITCAIATPIDISTTKGSFRFWFYVPTGALTDLTDVTVQLGSDSSNYYEWTTLAAALSEGWNYLVLNFTDATPTGTPVDTAIDYFGLIVNYAGTYTDKAGWRICALYTYSATSTEPQMSMLYFQASDTDTRYLLCNVSTNLFLYEETTGDWEAIKTGLTDGSRFDMTAYKNIMYLTNGIDNYMSFDGTTVAEHTGANTYKGKYLLLANDVGYILGDPSAPSTLGYTNATPTNLQTFPNALVLDEDSSDGKGTGLINLGPIVLASKEGKIYKVNVATPSREQIDYSNGFLSDRAQIRVENEVFGINKSGIYTLAQREATIGSIRADALSDDIKQIIDDISDKTVVSAIYVEKLKNAYFFCDADGNGVADTALVFSVLTKKWTTYNNMVVNQAVIYKDSDGEDRFIAANAANGQTRELETGLLDVVSEIEATVETKDFDFEQPETWKTFETVEIFGFIGATSKMTANILVDGENRSGNVIIDGADYVTESGGVSLGVKPLASQPIAGGASGETITFYPFKARIPMYATGARIQIRMCCTTLGSQWILTKASIYPFAQPLDVYPADLIY